MSNGMPGNMALEVAQAALRRGYTLVPYSLTAETTAESVVSVRDADDARAAAVDVRLVRPSERDAIADEMRARYAPPGTALVCVDFTHPSAVNENAAFYHRHALDFVMGTTGGDREALLRETRASGVYAVIAPNMAKQIVAFQAMMEIMASEFPGAFDGYSLRVVESHQSGKADTSGTARAVVESMRRLRSSVGVADSDDDEFDVRDIEKVRQPAEQMRRMRVPEAHLAGHAFHTYSLRSGDGTVEFAFQHNVCGRRVYADGTMDAVAFLDAQRRQRPAATGATGADGGDGASAKRVFAMVDVLRAGAMR